MLEKLDLRASNGGEFLRGDDPVTVSIDPTTYASWVQEGRRLLTASGFQSIEKYWVGVPDSTTFETECDEPVGLPDGFRGPHLIVCLSSAILTWRHKEEGWELWCELPESYFVVPGFEQFRAEAWARRNQRNEATNGTLRNPVSDAAFERTLLRRFYRTGHGK